MSKGEVYLFWQLEPPLQFHPLRGGWTSSGLGLEARVESHLTGESVPFRASTHLKVNRGTNPAGFSIIPNQLTLICVFARRGTSAEQVGL